MTDGRARRLETATLLAATVTSFMAPYLISAVNVALPAIQKEFGISAVSLSWVATAYLLSTAVFLAPMGKIGDIHGRKRVFALGLVVFTLASLLSALAPSAAILILTRAAQGIGAAMILTGGMAILVSVFPPERRGRAIGIYVAAVYVGLSVGPTAGGMLTHHYGWRGVFWSALPLGVLSVGVTLACLKPEWKGPPGQTFDLKGSLVYGLALSALMIGASLGPRLGAACLAVCGLMGLWWFARIERTIPWPVFEMGLFYNNRVFTFSSLAALINYAATFAVTFMMSLYLQVIQGFSSQDAGFILVAQPVVMALLSPLAGRWSDRVEPRILATSGMGVTAAGLAALVTLSPTTPVSLIISLLAMMGLGFALFSSPNMNAIMGAVEKKHFGVASGAVATMRLMGQMLSMGIVTLVFSLFLGGAPASAAKEAAFLSCLRVIFSVCAGLCLVGMFFSSARGNLRSVPPPE